MISVGCNRLDVSSIHIPGLDNVGKIKLIIEILTEMLHEVESAKTSVVLFNKLLALPPAEREKVLTKAVEAAK